MPIKTLDLVVRYPARKALARVAQNGTADEQKKVRAAVEKKYPSLKKADQD